MSSITGQLKYVVCIMLSECGFKALLSSQKNRLQNNMGNNHKPNKSYKTASYVIYSMAVYCVEEQ